MEHVPQTSQIKNIDVGKFLSNALWKINYKIVTKISRPLTENFSGVWGVLYIIYFMFNSMYPRGSSINLIISNSNFITKHSL